MKNLIKKIINLKFQILPVMRSKLWNRTEERKMLHPAILGNIKTN